MNMKRRTFLTIGGAFIVAVAAGGVYRAVQQGVFTAGQGPAYEPWKNWRDAASGLERIVRAGILAANPHNSQPWYFHAGGQVIDLFADYSRQIGVIDPLRREMHIGLGCAVENMTLAAQAEGFAAQVTLLPGGANPAADPAHVARLALTPAPPQTSDLYSAIPARHTNRGPYDRARAIAPDVLNALAALSNDDDLRLYWYMEHAPRDTFGKYAVASAEALIADEQQSMDSHRWWRQDWQDLQAHRDGLTVDAQAFDGLTNLGAKMLPDVSRQQSDAIFVQNTRDTLVATAPTFGLIAVRNQDDNAQRMGCGRLWQRMHLWATLHGLAMQPLNQMCERADRERQLGLEPRFGRALRELTGSDEWHGIMPFRIGYPLRQARLSPRRSVQEVLR
jgi:hypothetical protein